MENEQKKKTVWKRVAIVVLVALATGFTRTVTFFIL